MPGVPRLIAGTVLLCAVIAVADTAWAGAPYRPPGGPHRLHHGGDNQAPYPPLATTPVEPPGPHAAAVRLALVPYPNPARGELRFRLLAPAGEQVRVRVYGVSGRLVREWRQGGTGAAGLEWGWDGRDAAGRRLGSGLYFYRADAGAETTRGKLVLLAR